MKRIVLFIAILFSSYALAQECETNGFKYCNGGCYPAADCNRKNPPPPGLVLPIDSNIYFLLAAGLGLGIYFLGFKGKKLLASSSSSDE
jgi:hypothetical protein